jgi:serine/threonine protein kinase
MAAQPAVHPSEEALRAFALGKLDDATASVLMSHLDSCPHCCKVVAALSGDDFLAQLRQAHGHSRTPAPAEALPLAAPAAKPHAGPTPVANPPPDLAANQQYEILRELGRGGMGVVYLAKNKLMDRLEVLKVVSRTLLDRPGAVERFLREIRSAAKLSHANVVTAYHALQVGELLAFAMEYVEGQDLASLVKARGPLPVAYACYYVQQAALGLQHAYEEKMVHRDIKPQNLMLTQKGKKHIVKVLDFGLAKATREKTEDTGLTGEGKMLGTPDYIAPEQTLDAAKADIRADIYSLGCTLYYLLSGHPPFSGASLGAILLAHQMQEAQPLNLVRPEVPEELAAVVRKMMAKDPAKRYQTPSEVAQALAPFVKQGATPKVTPELSVGMSGAKPAIKKAARVDPPPVPIIEAAKQQSEPVDAWESLMEGSTSSIPARRAVKPTHRAASVMERIAQKKWLIGSGVGMCMVLLAFLGMWVGGVFKAKTPAIAPEPEKAKATKLPAYEHGDGKWSIEGDELVQDSTAGGPIMLLFGDASWTDYEATVQAKRKEGRELCFLVFRFENMLNSYYFGPWAECRELHFHTLIDGTNKPVIADIPRTVNDDWHTLRVRVRGSDIQCFLDGELICQCTDELHRTGYVGLTTGNTATHFRNLKVTSADGRVLVGGVRDLELQGERAQISAHDPFKAGSLWRGRAYPSMRGRDLPSNPMRLKILTRTGTRFEGEYWEERKGLKIAGNLDAKGNISLRATEILNNEDGGWPDAILDTTLIGNIVGKQLHMIGIYPDGMHAEIRATRED